MITIAIVDNHPLMRQGLKDLFGRYDDFKVILEAPNGYEFTQQLALLDSLPDVAIVDISMPVMDGFETTGFLKQHFPFVKILAVSMYHDDRVISRMMQLGASGYVTKTSDAHVFIEAVYAIVNNNAFVHNHINQ